MVTTKMCFPVCFKSCINDDDDDNFDDDNIVYIAGIEQYTALNNTLMFTKVYLFLPVFLFVYSQNYVCGFFAFMCFMLNSSYHKGLKYSMYGHILLR